MKKLGILFCLMSFLCLLCSCSKDSDDNSPKQEESFGDRLIGTWIYKSYTRDQATFTIGTPSKLTFFRGGKFTFKGDSMTPWLEPGIDNIIDIEGTYSYDENTATLTMVRSSTQYKEPVTLYFSVSFPTNGITLWGKGTGYSDWIWDSDKE